MKPSCTRSTAWAMARGQAMSNASNAWASRNWIERQLHPEKIDDSSLQARLAEASRRESERTSAAGRVSAARGCRQEDGDHRRGVSQAHGRADPSAAGRASGAQQIAAGSVQRDRSRPRYCAPSTASVSSQEQLTDFWFNHFNVFANKDLDLWLVASYESDAIRPHVLGQLSGLARRHGEEPGDAVLSGQLSQRRSASRSAPKSSSRKDARAPVCRATAGGQPRAERKLRPRADGAAHSGRGRRLYAAGRDRSGAQLHGLDHTRCANQTGICI